MEGYVYLTEKDLLRIARYLKLTPGGVRDQVCVSNQASAAIAKASRVAMPFSGSRRLRDTSGESRAMPFVDALEKAESMKTAYPGIYG